MKARAKALFASDGYNQLLRWLALPVTDRRWAAPLAAVALGFGLFVGVALGPGTAGSLATNVAQIVEEEEPVAEEGGGEGGGEASKEPTGEESSGGFEEEGGFEETESFEEGGFEFAAEPEGSAPFTEPSPKVPPVEPEEEGSGEEGQTVPAAGTVVHVNPAAGSYALVEPGGTLVAVHAGKLPVAGGQVSVPVRTLANGTFVEAGPRKQKGRKAAASFSGIVTHVDADPAAPAYAISKRGVSVLVNVRPDPTGAAPVLPVLGAYATVAVEIEAIPAAAVPPAPVPPAEPAPAPLCDSRPLTPPVTPPTSARLWQAELEAEGVPFSSSDFAGIVTAVCPSDGKLFLSADDLREGGADISFTVPKKLDTSRLKVGDSVLATADIGADGTLTLTGLAGNEKTKGADDAKATQGDLVNHNAE